MEYRSHWLKLSEGDQTYYLLLLSKAVSSNAGDIHLNSCDIHNFEATKRYDHIKFGGVIPEDPFSYYLLVGKKPFNWKYNSFRNKFLPHDGGVVEGLPDLLNGRRSKVDIGIVGVELSASIFAESY